ncbi:unnamed protein product [Closterium sp. NIES-65]|nr:unnamed protein product [Closterium sp. NIES-65]
MHGVKCPLFALKDRQPDTDVGAAAPLVPRPCALDGNGEMHVLSGLLRISVKFPAVARIGALRIALPTDLRPKEARHAVLVTAEIAEQKLEVLKRRGQLHVQADRAEIAEQKLEVLKRRGELLAVQPRSLSLFKSEPGLSAQIQAEKPLTDAQTTASRVPATTADSGEGGMEMCGTIGSAGGVHEGGELVRVFELGSPLASFAGSRAAAVTHAGVASQGGYNVTTAEEEEQLAAPGSKRWCCRFRSSKLLFLYCRGHIVTTFRCNPSRSNSSCSTRTGRGC